MPFQDRGPQYPDQHVQLGAPEEADGHDASVQLRLLAASANPVLHAHANDPTWFMHVCWQPPLLVAHSLMSAK